MAGGARALNARDMEYVASKGTAVSSGAQSGCGGKSSASVSGDTEALASWMSAQTAQTGSWFVIGEVGFARSKLTAATSDPE